MWAIAAAGLPGAIASFARRSHDRDIGCCVAAAEMARVGKAGYRQLRQLKQLKQLKEAA